MPASHHPPAHRVLRGLLAASLALGMSLPASAALVSYGSRAAFDAAVSGRTLIDFEGLAPAGLFLYYPSGLSVSGVHFEIDTGTSNGFLFAMESAYAGYAPTAVLSSQASTQADDNIVVNLGGSYRSIALDLGGYGPDVGLAFDLVTLTLSNGEVIQATSGDRHPENAFVGFTADVGITSLRIAQAAKFGAAGPGVLNIDNFSFGDRVGALPEPGSLALVTVAALAAAARRRRLG